MGHAGDGIMIAARRAPKRWITCAG